MARKKFHMTPKGPKPCRASQGKCHYAHYNTKEGAEAAHNMQQKQQNFQEEKNALQSRIADMTPDEKTRIHYDLFDRGDFGQQLAQQREEIYQRTGKFPQLTQGTLTATIPGGEGPDYQFVAEKEYDVTGTPVKLTPTWNLRIQHEAHGQRFVHETTSIPLSTPVDGQQLKKEAYSMLTRATHTASANTQRADAQRDALVDSFINGVSSIETSERGPDNADSLGFSFFQGTTDNRIVARADYAETSFGPRTLQRALQSTRYAHHTPDMNIMVQDSNAKKSSAYWTVTHENDEWYVRCTDAGGSTTTQGPYREPSDVAHHTYEFAVNNMEHASRNRAHESSRYVHNLVESVAKLKSAHQKRVAEQKDPDLYHTQSAGTGNTSAKVLNALS